MANQIELYLNEKREAEYFGDRFFFGIQSAGQLYLWSLNFHNALFLGLGLGMLYQFVLSWRNYSRLRANGNKLMHFDEKGITHFAIHMHNPVFIPWESVTSLESRKYFHLTALRFHLQAGQGKQSHGTRRFLDIPSDLLGKAPLAFANELARFPRTAHLGIPSLEASESTAQAA